MQSDSDFGIISIGSCNSIHADEYIFYAIRQYNGGCRSGISGIEKHKFIEMRVSGIGSEDLIIVGFCSTRNRYVDYIILFVFQGPHRTVLPGNGKHVISHDQGVFLIFLNLAVSGLISAWFCCDF